MTTPHKSSLKKVGTFVDSGCPTREMVVRRVSTLKSKYLNGRHSKVDTVKW